MHLAANQQSLGGNCRIFAAKKKMHVNASAGKHQAVPPPNSAAAYDANTRTQICHHIP